MITFLLGLVTGAAGYWMYRTFWKPEDRWEDTWAAPPSPAERPSATETTDGSAASKPSAERAQP